MPYPCSNFSDDHKNTFVFFLLFLSLLLFCDSGVNQGFYITSHYYMPLTSFNLQHYPHIFLNNTSQQSHQGVYRFVVNILNYIFNFFNNQIFRFSVSSFVHFSSFCHLKSFESDRSSAHLLILLFSTTSSSGMDSQL